MKRIPSGKQKVAQLRKAGLNADRRGWHQVAERQRAKKR
jgi:hypothetical protein